MSRDANVARALKAARPGKALCNCRRAYDEVCRGVGCSAAVYEAMDVLAGQACAFTWDDVDMLRATAMEWQTPSRPNGDEALNDLADRLATRLPPEPTP